MEVLYCNDFPYVHKSENFKKTGSLWLSEATKVGFSEVLLRIRQRSVITDGTKKTNDNNNYNNDDDQDN